MAYRNFHVEKIYDAPDIGILERGLDKAADNISSLFRTLSEQQIAKRKNADQYKFDLGEGKFENDDKIFFEKGLNITQRGKYDIRTMGRISPETEKDQNFAITEKKQSDWQYKKFAQNEGEIAAREKEDTYYDGTLDRESNKLAAYGENNDVYYATRGERLEAFDKFKGKIPQSLKGKLYTHDYVGWFRAKQKTKTTGDPTYDSTTFDSTPFLTPQGTPGVTVDHAKEYLDSRPDGSVARWIENMVDTEMDADVSYNKERNADLKKLSDEEVKLYLKANPSQNKLSQKDFATRVIEKAQSELVEAAEIQKRTDYKTKVDKSLTQGLFTNDNIGHSPTEHRDADLGAAPKEYYEGGVAFPAKPSENVMPGGNLLIGKGAKIGQPIPVTFNPRHVYNIRNGENSEVKGSTDVNMTGYQLQVYDNNGKVVAMNANDINNISPDQLKNTHLGIAIRGFTIENGNKLGEIASKKSQLDDELSDAITNNDTEKQALVEKKIMMLDKLKSNMNLSKDEFSDSDLMGAFRQNGIPVNTVRRDVLLEASEADLNIINRNLTQGLNLQDKNKWSNQMRDFESKYEQRKVSAPTPPPAKAKPATTGKMRTIRWNNYDLEVAPGRIAVLKPGSTDPTSIPEGQRQLAIDKGYTIIE